MAAILDSVVGHTSVIHRLKEAVMRDHLPSTLMFVGPAGIGKRRVAWGLAQFLLCEKPESAPCGECPSCIRVDKGQHENVLAIAPEGAQIKIDQAHDVLQFLSLAAYGRPRLVIIDQAEKLGPQAANALLKVLEEPSANVYFILVTEAVSGLLPTIRSRSQILRFAPLSSSELAKIEYVPDWVARACRGQLGMARNLMTPEWEGLRQQAFESLDLARAGEVEEAIHVISGHMKDREALLALIRLWQQFLRDAVLARALPDRLVHRDRKEAFEPWAQHSDDSLFALFQRALALEQGIDGHWDRNLSCEAFFYQAGAPQAGLA